MAIRSTDPATGRTLAEYPALTGSEMEERLALAWAAFRRQRREPPGERAGRMAALAGLLERRKHELGELMTSEMGKPLKAAVAEAEKCAWACRYYAAEAERLLADEVVETDAARSWVRYQPLGPVLAVMPWNFPFWQVFRFAAPAVMAGNVAILKHASNVPGCALAIEQLFADAGFEPGVFQTLLVEADAVEGILDDPRVRAATLTGSTPAGSAVAERAGKRIKKTVLELGGSDPFIVMPSADLPMAIDTAVRARTINNGQSCIAAKRFIVHRDVYEEFEAGFVAGMERLRTGDPMSPGTDVGPLATERIREDVHSQVERSVEAGARLLTGGRVPDGDGYFYPPTVLADAPEGSPARDEEIFGPVAALFRVDGLDEAIALANDTEFGLGSSVWTNDDAERDRLIEEIEAGQVFVNGMVASDPRLPFGGVKTSGYGRELARWGIHEFVNVKTVWVGPEGAGAE